MKQRVDYDRVADVYESRYQLNDYTGVETALVTFVEGELGRPIPPAAITLDNFDTINRIARFAEKLGGPA